MEEIYWNTTWSHCHNQFKEKHHIKIRWKNIYHIVQIFIGNSFTKTSSKQMNNKYSTYREKQFFGLKIQKDLSTRPNIITWKPLCLRTENNNGNSNNDRLITLYQQQRQTHNIIQPQNLCDYIKIDHHNISEI
jgi:hypothetical protein